MSKKQTFVDDEMYIKKSDVDAIRKRPSMWISSSGQAGVFHLCKEIIDNNRDECFKKDSPGDHIWISIYKDHIVTSDNGRGIATDLLQEVYETTQAGSNMTRAGGATAGENGVGTTCALALSSKLVVCTTRPVEKKKLTLVYKESKLVDRKLEDYDGENHGLSVYFAPSKKALGVDEIPVDDLVKWIKDFNYTLPENIKMDYNVCGKHYQVAHKPIKMLLETEIGSDNMMTPIMNVHCTGKLDETVLGELFHRTFEVDVALVYSNPDKYKGEDIRHSWMNMIHTIDNGSHVDGVLSGFIKYMIGVVVKKNKKLDNTDLKKDVLAHLSVVVKGSCDCATMFSSQSKHKVFLKELGDAITKAFYEAMDHVSTSTVNAFADVIIGNHRARVAGEQARDIKSLTKVKKQWTVPDSFIPCSTVKTEHPKEIFFVEGNSAGGGLNGARDARFQAILFFKGKLQNVYDLDPQRALSCDSCKHIIPTLGCGIPADIKKLKYDKIIIATDADIDGYHIRTLILTFFIIFLPELIYAGKVYVAEPPLYKLVRGKDVKYVATQNEYIEYCIKSISDLKIDFPIASTNKINVSDFVTEAFDYLTTLKEVSVNRSVNRYLLEYIAYGIATYGSRDAFIKNIDKWLKSIASVFKEIGFDHNTNQVFAVIELIDNFVLIDDELLTELDYVINIIKKYGLLIHYQSSKRNVDTQTELSHFFEYIEDAFPQIKGRYKGLGSSDPEVLREVVMDPSVRRIYQVTMEDAVTLQKMGALMGSGKDNINQRKDMLMNFKFTKADIDS